MRDVRNGVSGAASSLPPTARYLPTKHVGPILVHHSQDLAERVNDLPDAESDPCPGTKSGSTDQHVDDVLHPA